MNKYRLLLSWMYFVEYKVRSVEEQVRASAEHKLGVANQSITAGFFDNNTSAEDRREYLESLLRECKKEESAPVLDDDALNNILARSEDEIDIFESIDKQRLDEEMAVWLKVVQDGSVSGLDPSVLPSRLVSDDDLKPFCHAMKIYESSNVKSVKVNVRKKGELGGLDTKHYGRGKRAREVRSYEDQWTEEEFEKLCQAESPDSPQPGCVPKDLDISKVSKLEVPAESSVDPVEAKMDPVEAKMEPVEAKMEPVPAVLDSSPAKKRRGRPRRSDVSLSPVTSPAKAARQETGTTFGSSAPASTIDSVAPAATLHSTGPDATIHSAVPVGAIRPEIGTEIKGTAFVSAVPTATMKPEGSTDVKDVVVLEGSIAKEVGISIAASASPYPPAPATARGRKTQAGEIPRRRGRKPKSLTSSANDVSAIPVVAVGSGASSVGSPYPQGDMSSSHASGVPSFQKDLVTDRPVTSLPEGVKGISAPEGMTPAAEGICTGTAVSSDNASSLLPKIIPTGNVGFVQASSEQVPSASVPTIPVMSAGMLKASHVLLADKPAEKQGASRRRRKKAPDSEDTGVSTRQRSAMKKSYGTPGTTDNVGADMSTAEKLRIVKGSDGSSLQDTSKELLNINSPLYDKSGYDSQPRTPIAVPISEATLPSGFDDAHITYSDITPRMSTNPDVQDKPVNLHLEAPLAVASQTQVPCKTGNDHVPMCSEVTTTHAEVVTDKSLINPVSEPANVQFEPPGSSLHTVKDISPLPLAVDSVAPTKTSGRRRKASAAEPRTRSKSATAASERRARLAGAKQTGDVKKLEILSSPSTTVCVSSVEQQKTAPAELLTASVCEEQKDAESHVRGEISTSAGIPDAKLEPPKQTATQSITACTEETDSSLSTQTPTLPKSKESNLSLGDKQDLRVQSLDGQTKMVLAAELASANNEEDKLHEVHDKTASGIILSCSVTQDTLQDQTDSSADLNLVQEAEKNDSTAVILPDCQTSFDASDKDTKDALASTVADVNDLQSEGATVDVTSPKQDTTIAEALQTDDISGGSASHLPAALQSTDSNQPADQKENSGSKLLASGKKTDEMEGTLDKNQEKDHPEAEKNDSTTVMLPDRQTPFDVSDKDTKDTLAPTEADDSGLHSEGAAVDVTSPKQDTTIVEASQTDGISGGSASHLPADSQSTDSNQPAGQKGSSENSGSKLFEGILESGKKTEEMEGTLDYNLTSIQTNDDARNIEDSVAHAVNGGDLVGSKPTTAEVDGSDEALNALSTLSNEDASMVKVVVSSNDSTSACEVKKDPESHVSVPVLASAAMSTGDDSEEAHNVPSTHPDREASMVEVGASRNDDTSVCRVENDSESNVFGESTQAGLSELKLELPNQSQSSSQSNTENVEETHASYNIHSTSLVESERKSPGNGAHGTPEGMELAEPKIECTIQMPSPDEKSTEVHNSVQVEMVSAAEQASIKDDKEHKPVVATFSSGGEHETLLDNVDNSTDVDPTCPRDADCEGGKDHSPKTILAGSQSLCEVSDKDIAPTKDDHTDLQSEGNIAGMNGGNQDYAETEAMQIDAISKGSSSDLPAALQPADSNQPAEQDGLENSASISACPNEHEKMKETSNETGGGNSKQSQTDDNSHAMNLVGYSPSEDSGEDDSVQVADAGDLVGSKETTVDAVPAIVGVAEPREGPCGGSAIAGGAEPEPASEIAVPEDGSTMDPGSVQVSTTEPEAKKEDDGPTLKENVESAAVNSETDAGTEADPSKEASVPPQEGTTVASVARPEQNEEANTSTQEENTVEPAAIVPDHVEHASTEQVLNTRPTPDGENLKLGEAKTEQVLQPSPGEDTAVTGAKTPCTEHACNDGTSDQKEADVAADESPVVVGEEVVNTEIAPDGKTPGVGEADAVQSLPSPNEGTAVPASEPASLEGAEAPSADLPPSDDK